MEIKMKERPIFIIHPKHSTVNRDFVLTIIILQYSNEIENFDPDSSSRFMIGFC